ncbi:hypothetical protein K505DRAFT_367196 [Melanomma pulvis-pyrius CBS 109.77]|uniref:RING-type E3 ubiquitin transferase n=1 Tax=Melanomma pulvis-pyrius CBS 109.77 TaxID=1314802 RepID=A0A6A6WUN1_9PLEO|nr:hypothetical protein K505DRAFT_367196 [Melanomma pulvis-pyrius CBS 109.77]
MSSREYGVSRMDPYRRYRDEAPRRVGNSRLHPCEQGHHSYRIHRTDDYVHESDKFDDESDDESDDSFDIGDYPADFWEPVVRNSSSDSYDIGDYPGDFWEPVVRNPSSDSSRRLGYDREQARSGPSFVDGPRRSEHDRARHYGDGRTSYDGGRRPNTECYSPDPAPPLVRMSNGPPMDMRQLPADTHMVAPGARSSTSQYCNPVQNPSNDTCGICREGHSAREPLVMPCVCTHTFHVSCLDEWVNCNRCPTCRRSICPEGRPLYANANGVTVPVQRVGPDDRH